MKKLILFFTVAAMLMAGCSTIHRTVDKATMTDKSTTDTTDSVRVKTNSKQVVKDTASTVITDTGTVHTVQTEHRVTTFDTSGRVKQIVDDIKSDVVGTQKTRIDHNALFTRNASRQADSAAVRKAATKKDVKVAVKQTDKTVKPNYNWVWGILIIALIAGGLYGLNKKFNIIGRWLP